MPPRPLHESARYRGHDEPPLRSALDVLLRHVPYPLWPGRWAARLRVQGRVGVTAYRQVAPALRAPLRLAFASDFHAGPMTDARHLRRAVEQLRALAPDLLLLGGDFVSGRATWARALVDDLATLRPPLGTFAVLGNHDLWSDFDELEVMLLTAGIELVTNRAVRLPPPHDEVTVAGLDDHESGLPDATPLAQAEGFRLLLLHSPSGIHDLDGARFDLALAGHTHAGQIALPGGLPILLPQGEGLRRMCYGRFDGGVTGSGTLIVSRGVGYSSLPLRAFAPAEVVLVELVPG